MMDFDIDTTETSNIISLSKKRIEYGHCRHTHMTIDKGLALVTCNECKKQLDPLWVLTMFATEEEQLSLFDLPELNECNGEIGPCIPLKSQILELTKTVLGNQRVVFERVVMTPKQEETDIKRDIDRYLKKYAHDQGFEIQEINKEVKAITGKPRKEMTLLELRYCFNKIQTQFPLRNPGIFIPVSRFSPVFDVKSKPFNINEENFF